MEKEQQINEAKDMLADEVDKKSAESRRRYILEQYVNFLGRTP
jgi:hypothetical protein